MSKTTFVQEGNLLDYRPVADAKAGDIAFWGTICGQVTSDVAANQLGALRTEGVIRVSKASGTVFAEGDAVHWDDTNSVGVDVATDGVMGKAVGGGADGELYVDVKLNA